MPILAFGSLAACDPAFVIHGLAVEGDRSTFQVLDHGETLETAGHAGNPIEGVEFALVHAENGWRLEPCPVGTTTSGADGRFEVLWMVRHDNGYVLEATRPGYHPVRIPFSRLQHDDCPRKRILLRLAKR